MVKSHVKVFIRNRPIASVHDGFKVHPDGVTVDVKLPKDADAGLINNKQEAFGFKYDGVLENVSQETVYTTCCHEVVDSLLQGYNGTVFCYGQTGAGKTFTISGDIRKFNHRGVAPRAIHHVFREIDMRVDKIYAVHVSYLEIYNEQMYDLLAENPGTADNLAILDDPASGTTYVRGLTKVQVRSEEEALAQFFIGEQGRSTAEHVLNASSSRSHCVFTLHVEMRTSEAASEKALLSKLHLVDLAGSERTKKTNVSGQAMKEAQFINRSLSFLEQTVNALAKKDAHVPFRQSKLTSVLRDALGGNCKTVMIANVWAEPDHLEETLSTLRFASRVRMLVTDISTTESSDPGLLIRKYERQIKELKQELAMRDTLSGRGRISYDDLTDSELRELNQLVRRFLQGEAEVEELPSDSLKRIREAYKQCRAVHQAMRAELAEQIRLQGAAASSGAVAQNGASSAAAGDGVGDVDTGAQPSFQIGVAPSDARPSSRMTERDGGGVGAAVPGGVLEQQAAIYSSMPGSPGNHGMGPAGDPSSSMNMGSNAKNMLFARFKYEVAAGGALAGVLRERSGQLRELKQAVKDCGASVNGAKASVDSLSERLGQKALDLTGAKGPGGQAQGQGQGEVLDSEQYQLMSQLKQAKIKYRTEFERLKEMRSQLEGLTLGVAEARQALVEGFNKWAAGAGMGMVRTGSGRLISADEDELDPGEAFDKMQLDRIMAADPDSGAFYAAQKQSKMPGHLRSSAQFAGVKGQATATRKQEHEQKIAFGLAK